jgi:hypothetical protein
VVSKIFLFVWSGFIEGQLAHIGNEVSNVACVTSLGMGGCILLHPLHPPIWSCMYARLLAYVVVQCW